MIDESSFPEYVRRIRAGDEQAARQLVLHYEPFIRREVRGRLRARPLCRVLDSLDICQSVLASFFVRAAAGQYDLERPEDLLTLLVGMAHNKLVSQVRHAQRQRRDQRRVAADGAAALAEVAAAGPSPSQLAAGKELLQEVSRHLTTEERRLADLRGQGFSWDEIAAELGGTAQARRMQLTRALDRVSRLLGLEEASDE